MDTEARLERLEELYTDTWDRIGRLEEFAVETRERLMRIETRLDQTATKADLADLSATMVKWIVGMVSGAGLAAITVMTFVLNNAVPKAAPQPPPAPIVIQLPPSR
jgi:hypothetical protein